MRHIGPASEEDSVGDVLAFANPVFDSANEKRVGSDNGQCVDSVLAITGGTANKDASGQMTLRARNDEETEFDFTYEVDK